MTHDIQGTSSVKLKADFSSELAEARGHGDATVTAEREEGLESLLVKVKGLP